MWGRFKEPKSRQFPSIKLKGKKPLSASILAQKYLRPATALVKLKVDLKKVQGVLRHEDFGTTKELYAQSHMESMRDAQGKFLKQLMGTEFPAHGASSVRIMGG